MRTLTAEQIAGNAYRTLGLPATASQSDVEQAARRMRIWPDGRRVPPTAWDVPWVGTLVRSRGAIDQAVARLMDPESRVTERLVWFHTGVPTSGPDAGDAFNRELDGLAGSETSAARHSAVLAGFVAASAHDPDVADIGRWRRVMESVQALATSDAFRDYLIELEAGGDFEKRAAVEEVVGALAALPGAVVAGIAAKAESALEDEKLEPAVNVARLLKATNPSACRRVLDRVEDVIERRCAATEEELRRTVEFRDDSRHANEIACRRAQHHYDKSIEPVVQALDTFASEEPQRGERVRWACARLLSVLGMAWIGAYCFRAADRTFRTAKELAKGTALERRIDAQIEENAPRIRESHPSYHVMDVQCSTFTVPAEESGTPNAADIRRPAVHRPNVEYEKPRSFKLAPSRPRPSRVDSTKSTFAGGSILIIVLVGVLRAIMSGVGTAPSSSPSYRSNPLYLYTPPRTSPTYVPPYTLPPTKPEANPTPSQNLFQENPAPNPLYSSPGQQTSPFSGLSDVKSNGTGVPGDNWKSSTNLAQPDDLSLTPTYSDYNGSRTGNNRGRSQ